MSKTSARRKGSRDKKYRDNYPIENGYIPPYQRRLNEKAKEKQDNSGS